MKRSDEARRTDRDLMLYLQAEKLAVDRMLGSTPNDELVLIAALSTRLYTLRVKIRNQMREIMQRDPELHRQLSDLWGEDGTA